MESPVASIHTGSEAGRIDPAWPGFDYLRAAGLGLLMATACFLCVTMIKLYSQPDNSLPAALTEKPDSAESTAASGWYEWQGMRLPRDQDAGPSSISGGLATGFARTAKGAALAAANLSVRIDAHAGPDCFLPTIRRQVDGSGEALEQATLAAYRQASTAAGRPAQGPIPTAANRIAGWQIAEFDRSGPVLVDLLVETPADRAIRFGIRVVWRSGSWKLTDPLKDPRTFVSSPTKRSGYESF